jgi:RNA recognition motif-containing protein
MGRKLYVGNLPFSMTDAELTDLFAGVGQVESARIMRDQSTGQARGFGFVEMGSDEDAQKAISQLNQRNVDGRSIVVNEARPRAEGGAGGGRGGFGGGGGYGGGGGAHKGRGGRGGGGGRGGYGGGGGGGRW